MELRIDSEFESFIPALSKAERKGLEQSVLSEGVRDPLVVWADTILDGHNRYRIATGENEDGEVVEFEVVYKDFSGREAAKEWIAENQLNRRNLSKEWTSYLRGKAYKTAKKSHGGDRKSSAQNGHLKSGESDDPAERTAEDVAKKNGVGQATIRRDAEYADAIDRLVDEYGHDFRTKLLEGQSKLTKTDTLALAKTVDKQPEVSRVTVELLLNDATPDLNLAYLQARTLFELGEKTWDGLWECSDDVAKMRNSEPQLRHLLKMPDDETAADLVAGVESGLASSFIKMHEIREKERKKAAEDAKREQIRAEREAAPMPERKYEVVYADPPWRYEHSKSDSRKIENQYPTMSLEEIKAVAVPAADNATLIMWATSPKLVEAFEVMESWGFSYRTCMVWVKDKIGMGYYARQQHELVLIAKKGEPPVPEPANRPPSVFYSDREQHSAKPESFYQVVERMYPHESKVELFARSARDGWDAWGNEAILSEEIAS